MSTDTQPKQPQTATVRAYEPPQLTVVGTVGELTLSPHDPHPAPPGSHVLALSA